MRQRCGCLRRKCCGGSRRVISVLCKQAVRFRDTEIESDTIEILQDLDLSAVLKRCTADAMERAVRAGAKPDTVKVVEMENLPVQVSPFR